MSDTFVLAIDQGTTGSTALWIDAQGEVRGKGYAELPQHFPRPGWVEHDPEEIWDCTLRAMADLFERTGIESVAAAAIGITNQRETTLVWERAIGRPVARAIVWQDRRTAPRCAALRKAGKLRETRRRTGLVLDPYFSGTKVEWLLKHVSGVRAQARLGRLAFGTVDTWLLWKLTGGAVHATEPTNASRTLLYNIERQRWDDAMLGLFGVPASLMPEVFPSSGVFGHTRGVPLLPDGVPIAGMAGDQQAALFGQGCVKPGQSKNTYGTGSFLLLNTGAKRIVSRSGLLTTVACGPRGEAAYALEGSAFISGAALQWLRDGLEIIERAPDSSALARSVPDTGGVVMVPAFVGLGAPYWEPGARGALLGLTRGTTRAHVVRAALESMAFQSRDLFDAMAQDTGRRSRVLRVDGGAAANDWLMQYQADVLGVPVERPHVVETTALGAALLAGLAIGFWGSHRDLDAARKVERVFKPQKKKAWRDAEYRRWQAAVRAVLAMR